jgi:uncharacterized membrane protein
MNLLPPLPPPDGFHPLVVHFPIALLLAVPVFVVLGLLWRGQRHAIFVAATLLLLLGAAGAVAAVLTGEAAEGQAESLPAARAALERHEELAELARNLFLGLLALAVVLTVLHWRFRERARPALVWSAAVIFLVLHGAASLVLVNAAHEGGRLVHQFGARAPTAAAPPAPAAPAAGNAERGETGGGRARDDDD